MKKKLISFLVMSTFLVSGCNNAYSTTSVTASEATTTAAAATESTTAETTTKSTTESTTEATTQATFPENGLQMTIQDVAQALIKASDGDYQLYIDYSLSSEDLDAPVLAAENRKVGIVNRIYLGQHELRKDYSVASYVEIFISEFDMNSEQYKALKVNKSFKYFNGYYGYNDDGVKEWTMNDNSNIVTAINKQYVISIYTQNKKGVSREKPPYKFGKADKVFKAFKALK